MRAARDLSVPPIFDLTTPVLTPVDLSATDDGGTDDGGSDDSGTDDAAPTDDAARPSDLNVSVGGDASTPSKTGGSCAISSAREASPTSAFVVALALGLARLSRRRRRGSRSA